MLTNGVVTQLNSTTTLSILQTLSGWFNVLGWPRSIRSDGGPQFRGEFSSFCEKNNIKHELSAPYNPRSNGLAESAVKIVKNIFKKCSEENGDPERALYEWRNLPRDHGYSPAQLMFGQRQRVYLPMHDSAFSQIYFSQAAVQKDKKFSSQESTYNRGKMDLPMLAIGQVVRVQDERTGQWPTLAKVTEIHPDRLSYIVENDG